MPGNDRADLEEDPLRQHSCIALLVGIHLKEPRQLYTKLLHTNHLFLTGDPFPVIRRRSASSGRRSGMPGEYPPVA